MRTISPFYLDLSKSEISDLQTEFGKILESGQLILGKHTEDFESQFAKYVGSKYAVAMNTATSVLEVLCRLKNVEGKNVAVPSNTNFASVAAILRAGGIPVFMDMDQASFSPNLEILNNTCRQYDISGVLWVHIGGIISNDFQSVVDFCKGKNLFLLEDAAHAHGSWLNGISAGNFADGGAFSFFPTKVMTTMEGGILVTNSEEDAILARSMRNQGKRGAAYGGLHSDLGNSWRMSEISAYMGLIQLAKLDAMVKRRQSAVSILESAFDEVGIHYCSTAHMEQASQYKFIVKVRSGTAVDKVKNQLASKGIICGGGVYEVPCHKQPVFSGVNADESQLAETNIWCPRHICPPITSGTTTEDAQYMAQEITKILV